MRVYQLRERSIGSYADVSREDLINLIHEAGGREGGIVCMVTVTTDRRLIGLSCHTGQTISYI